MTAARRGEEDQVASYGCNSGHTAGDSVAGELVVFKEGMPADALRGKIAIVVKERGAGGSRDSDGYEYLGPRDAREVLHHR